MDRDFLERQPCEQDAQQALELLKDLNRELNIMHLDMNGDHRYALSAKAHPIITRIKQFLAGRMD